MENLYVENGYWFDDIDEETVINSCSRGKFLSPEDYVGDHMCIKSVFDGEEKPSSDELQANDLLLDNEERYTVCYFDDDNGDMVSLVDEYITGEQIKANVIAGKYTEGAMYFIFRGKHERRYGQIGESDAEIPDAWVDGVITSMRKGELV